MEYAVLRISGRRICGSSAIFVMRWRGERAGRDFAVLFRTNTQPRLLMEQMMEYNIPFRTRDRIPEPLRALDRKGYFLPISGSAQGSRERVIFLQIMNRPKNVISAEIHWTRTRWHSMCGNGISEAEQPWVAERIVTLEHDVMQLRRMNPFAAINYIRKRHRI